MHHVGAGAPVAKRSDLQDEHLRQLDFLVKREICERLKKSRSVSITSDGWRDRARRNWLDLGIAWISDSGDIWVLDVVDADLIPIPGAATGDILETLLKESVNEFVPDDCLISTSTSDGAGDERKAALQLVQDGNDLWCAAHRAQLAVDDCLDPKIAHPPIDCAPHRQVIQKSHSLVLFINSHRDAKRAFEHAAQRKRETDVGNKMWETLVLDNDTRWDTDLMLLERVVYFDAEILALSRDPQIGIPRDCLLERNELDLAYGMIHVLDPVREFTKFVQYRSRVTLAYLPKKLDNLVNRLAPNVFEEQIRGRSETVLPLLELLQSRLITSLRTRFSDIFIGSSLALAAAMLLPGRNTFAFQNFPIGDDIVQSVTVNMLDDFEILLPANTSAANRQAYRRQAESTLQLARQLLDEAPPNEDPLLWWPHQASLAPLFPLAKLLFAIPASSADNERSFSSASFTLDSRRYRTDIENFRSEHRIRRFIVAGTDGNSQDGRGVRLERVRSLLERFAELVGDD